MPRAGCDAVQDRDDVATDVVNLARRRSAVEELAYPLVLAHRDDPQELRVRVIEVATIAWRCLSESLAQLAVDLETNEKLGIWIQTHGLPMDTSRGWPSLKRIGHGFFLDLESAVGRDGGLVVVVLVADP